MTSSRLQSTPRPGSRRSMCRRRGLPGIPESSTRPNAAATGAHPVSSSPSNPPKIGCRRCQAPMPEKRLDILDPRASVAPKLRGRVAQHVRRDARGRYRSHFEPSSAIRSTHRPSDQSSPVRAAPSRLGCARKAAIATSPMSPTLKRVTTGLRFLMRLARGDG